MEFPNETVVIEVLGNLQKIIQDASQVKKISRVSFLLNNKSMQDHNIKEIAQTLSQLSQVKEIHLELHDSYYITNNSLIDLGRNLQYVPQLQYFHLSLDSNKYDEQGVEELFQGLKRLPLLSDLRLKLTKNQNINASCAEKISNGLKQLPKLTKLCLSLVKDNIGAVGAQHLENVFQQQNQLHHLDLYLGYNNIEDLGVQHISKIFDHQTQLNHLELDLRDNKIGNSGAQNLLDSFQYLNNLKEITLWLESNQIGEEQQQKFRETYQGPYVYF